MSADPKPLTTLEAMARFNAAGCRFLAAYARGLGLSVIANNFTEKAKEADRRRWDYRRQASP
jgi:hypothetical protein